MVTWQEVEIARKGAEKYIDWLRSLPPDEGRRVATESLIETGVLNEDGSPKEQIVTGDFFGW